MHNILLVTIEHIEHNCPYKLDSNKLGFENKGRRNIPEGKQRRFEEITLFYSLDVAKGSNPLAILARGFVKAETMLR